MSTKPKIAYFGSDAICIPGLRYLLEEANDICELALIVSQPDRRSGRGKRLQQNPVTSFALDQGLELMQPERPGSDLAVRLIEADLSLAFVMAYGHFLPKAIREAPQWGMFNFHGSILPSYRGASPVETAIALGEKETGVCLMQVVRQMDMGAVADCERVCIEEDDTGPDVRAKVGQAVVPLLERNLRFAISGELKLEAQKEGKASYCRKIRKEDAALDFKQSARALGCRMRAFHPWPGSYFDHGSTRIKVGMTKIKGGNAEAPPGTVIAAGESLDVATGKGILQIAELQRPGGRMIPVREFLKGYPIKEGELLPSVTGEDLLL